MKPLAAIDHARESDELTEVEGKPGLFIINELSPDDLNAQTYYLDLRNGFEFYGYNETGDPIRGADRADPPTVVTEIRAHYMAAGTAKLDTFLE